MIHNLSNQLKSKIKFPGIYCALYFPITREKFLNKAVRLNSNILIPDLEDSIEDSDKDRARLILESKLEFIKENKNSNSLVMPRINDVCSFHFEKDIEMIRKKIQYIDGIHLPKVHSVECIEKISHYLKSDFSNILIFPNFESARAIINLERIFQKFKNIHIAGLGGDDFLSDIGVNRTESGSELMYVRQKFSLTCLAYGIAPIDTPCSVYKSSDLLEKELNTIKSFGFKGKFAIHPNQIDKIYSILRPSLDEIEHAEEIIKLYDEAIKNKTGAIATKFGMIDKAHYSRAIRTLQMAGKI